MQHGFRRYNFELNVAQHDISQIQSSDLEGTTFRFGSSFRDTWSWIGWLSRGNNYQMCYVDIVHKFFVQGCDNLKVILRP